MNFSRLFSGWIGGLLGALAVVAIAVLGWVLLAPPASEEAQEPARVAAPEAGDAVAPEGAEEAAPEAATAGEADAPLVPSFDVVRIKPDGSALVAGRAEPGATVSVLVEGAEIATAKADGSAGFVAMFSLPPLEIDRVMTLEAELADGTRLVSEMSVIVEGVDMPDVVAAAEPAAEPAPPSAPEPGTAAPVQPEAAEAAPAADAPAPASEDQVAALEPSPSAPDAQATPNAAQDSAAPAQPTTESAEPATESTEAAPADTPQPPATATPETPAAPAGPGTPATPAPSESAAAPASTEAPAAPEPAAPPQPEAPRIILAGPDGVRVLQDTSPQKQLSIDAISYDDRGEVALSGRGQGEGTLRIYLDNAPVGTAEVGPEGQWRAPLPDIDAGVYTLRVDSLSPEGEVIGRVETPFMREEAAVLAAAGERAAAAAAEGRTLSAITVQPGHTLWAIAEGRYGEGIQYWAIFDANRDQIRDPDWIYPGQVFSLPDSAE